VEDEEFGTENDDKIENFAHNADMLTDKNISVIWLTEKSK